MKRRKLLEHHGPGLTTACPLVIEDHRIATEDPHRLLQRRVIGQGFDGLDEGSDVAETSHQAALRASDRVRRLAMFGPDEYGGATRRHDAIELAGNDDSAHARSHGDEMNIRKRENL
jgi:hypothetical protein